MPHPRAPKLFGGIENPSIEAAILSTKLGDGQAGLPLAADVMDAFLVRSPNAVPRAGARSAKIRDW